jgi:hypothetical protein
MSSEFHEENTTWKMAQTTHIAYKYKFSKSYLISYCSEKGYTNLILHRSSGVTENFRPVFFFFYDDWTIWYTKMWVELSFRKAHCAAF